MDKSDRVLIALIIGILVLILTVEFIVYINRPLQTDHPIIRKGAISYKQVSDESSFALPRAASLLLYKTGGGQCSGTMIAPHLFLTAKHCVAAEMVIFKADGHSFPAYLLKASHEGDLALLRTEADCPCVRVSKIKAEIDSKIIAIGFPRYLDLHIQIVDEGRIQGESPEWLVTTTITIPGKSGGGIFQFTKGNWELVGIIVAYLGGENPVPQYGLSPKWKDLEELLRGAEI